MAGPHEAVAVAQLVFFVPAVPVALYNLIRTWHNRPRQCWSPLLIFSLFRLSGAIVVIVQQQPANSSNIGLIIAAIVLLNVGLIPLLLSSLGFVRLLLNTADTKDRAHIVARVVRGAIVVAIILLSVGGGLEASQDSGATVGRDLGQAGYIIFSVSVFTIALMFFGLRRRGQVAQKKVIYLYGGFAAIPFIALRTVYGLLYVFNSDDLFSKWNPLFGSATAFALMALLPEYIALVIYLILGFHRMRTSVDRLDDEQELARTPKMGNSGFREM